MLNLEPCVPPLWAPTAHAQTVFGHLLPSPRLAQKGRRFEIRLDDGDQLVGHCTVGESAQVVYLFHGLSGDVDSDYMHRTARLALQLGHSVVMVNHRGCGEGVGLARRPYHSGRSEDLAAAISWGRSQFPRKLHVAIGFSLSGNALLLLVSGQRGHTLPDRAISVNAPIELAKAAEHLRVGFNRVYDFRFYRECRRDVLGKIQRGQESSLVATKLPWWGTVRNFDQVYTAPAGGFTSREDYYSQCSAAPHLHRIEVPTVMLTSEDDPFVPVTSYRDSAISKNVICHIEKYGGHMGYLARQPTALGTRRWLDYALDQCLRTLS